MHVEATLTPLEQLSEASRRTADALESMRAEMVAYRGRIEALETHLHESQAAGRRTAERVERVAAELERLKGLEALNGQIEALRESHVRTDDRIQQVAGELTRIGRVEGAVAQLRTEAGQEIESQSQQLRGEIAAQAKRRVEDGRDVAREIQSLATRLDQVERLGPRIEALARHQDEAVQAIHGTEARIDALATDAPRLEEALRRTEQHVAVEVTGLAEQVATLQEAIATWRARIEAQSETVRAAESVADAMQQEVARIHAAHHSTAEAQRMAEGRVDATLTAIREDVEARWERFLTERGKHWSAFAREIDTRETAVRDEIAAAREAVETRIDELQTGLDIGLEIQGKDLAELQRLVAAFVRSLRDVGAESAESFGASLPSADPSSESAERRQALRRALRARRSP
jgi:DNA repair exonuclease SbcCD ATPase subunit